ncbi:MAG: tetraacyldisaccharide 4'-kinase, partial [Steroidobacteraceae bacterium]|nr:tetraacyldisaccharide 4'-kinase [Steroidobacteraceae bacterium]MDW8260878.1 tetraacyldisaccharide 4'-kinase [Gammaproteobacteria bacterium]
MQLIGRALRGLWYRESFAMRGVAALLLPLSVLFAAVVQLRRVAYRRGWLRRYSSGVPLIVVGNLSAGGTGKTPLVLWLARRLTARGRRVGIVARGYGGRVRGPELVPAGADPAQVGDEAVLLA